MGGKTLSATEYFTVVIDPDTALEEIVDVYSYSSGNTLTALRGRDGSTGVIHSAGAVVRHMAIGRDYQESNDHIKNETTAHGITLANVTLSSGTGNVSTTMLASNAVTTAKITDANVTTAKIADSAVTSAKIADLTIASGDIADSAITSGKIATGAVGTTKIDDLSITEGKIVSSAITAAKIATDAVTTAKILDSNVTTAKIADSAITSAKIADATIATGDIADNAITSAKIADGTIVAGDIADGAITSAKILNGTIENADISASAAIAYSKLNLNGTITSADIVNGTIVAADIADGTITAAKLTADPFARANHTGTQLAATVSDFNTAVRTNRLDQMAAPTASVALNAQKITGLGTPTANTTDAATTAYVDTSIANLVNSAPGTLDTLGEIATAIQSGGTFYDSLVLKSGSTMTGALTLSGAPTVDLHAATKLYVDGVAGSATAAAASAAAAAASYDSFDDRYLGSKSSAPTLDNDGNSLVTGALYWNSVSSTMFAWTGSAWGSISSSAAIYRYKFIAAGGETSVSGADASSQTLAYIAGYEQVYLNGVLLVRGTDYTATNGTSITALSALVLNDIVEIITFTALSVVTDIPQSIVDAKGDLIVGTAADTVGRLAVGTNGQVLTADSTAGTGLAYTTPISASSTTTFTNKTISLTSNTISGTLAEFNTALSGDDFVSLTGAETLTNKTLTTPVLTNPKITLTYSAKTAAYTFVSGDEGNVFSMNNASTTQFNIPTDATFNFAIGTQFNVFWLTGAGQPTIGAVTPGTTTVISTGATSATPKLRVANSMATCLKIAANSWIVIGDIA